VLVENGEERAKGAKRDVLLTALIANLSGAAVLFVFLQWLSAGPVRSHRDIRIGLAVIVAYAAATAVLMYGRGARRASATVEWLAAGREPTEDDRSATLALPAHLAAYFFVFCVGHEGLSLIAGWVTSGRTSALCATDR
jgi:hypothetical protein